MTYMKSWKSEATCTGEYCGVVNSSAAAPEVLQQTKMALYCSLKVIHLIHWVKLGATEYENFKKGVCVCVAFSSLC